MVYSSKGQRACCCLNAFAFIIGAVLVTLGLLFELHFMNKIVESKAKKMITIQIDSDGKTLNDFSDIWLNNDYTIYKKYWLYNYTNYQDILTKNTKPILTEKGPYSYREKFTYDYNIPNNFHMNNEHFKYKKNITWTFDQGASCSDCLPNDIFIMPDIIFFSVADQLFNPVGFCLQLFSAITDGLESPPAPNLCEEIMDTILEITFGSCNLSTASNYLTIEKISSELAMTSAASGASPFMKVQANDLLFNGYTGIYPTLLNTTINDMLQAFRDATLNCTGQAPNAVHLPSIPSVSIIQKDKPLKEYVVNTGVYDYSLTGTMLQYNSSDNLPMGVNGSESWWTDYNCNVSCTSEFPTTTALYGDSTTISSANKTVCECTSCKNSTAFEASRLRGSNGDFFHALVKKSNVLPIFIEEICRPLNLLYQQESKVQDVKTYRFIIDPENFKTNEPGNCGYCRQLPRTMYGREKGSYCLPDGLLDLSGCEQQNAEIVVSYPHFLNADQKVKDMFPNLNSNPTQDITTVDIEPTTGSILAANKRMQINFIVKNYANTAWENITSGVYPLVWQDESFMMGPNTYDQIKKTVVNPQHLVKLLCYIIGVSVGALLMLISVISTVVLFFYFGRRKDVVKYYTNEQDEYISASDSAWGSPGYPASTGSSSTILRTKRLNKDFMRL